MFNSIKFTLLRIVMAALAMIVPLCAFSEALGSVGHELYGDWKTKTDQNIGVGNAMLKAGDRDKAESLFKIALSEAVDTQSRIKAAEALSSFYMSGSNFQAAVKVYENLLMDEEANEDTALIAGIYAGLGRIYFKQHLYVNSIKSFRTAEGLLTPQSDSVFVASLYSDMSRTLLEAGDIEESLALIAKAKKFVPENSVSSLLSIMNVEASAEAKYGNYQKAYEMMVEAFDYSNDAQETELSYFADYAVPAMANEEAKTNRTFKSQLNAMNETVRQADSMRRAAFAAAFVVGMVCVVALISFYLSFNRLRFYKERSRHLNKKLSDAQRVISIIARDSNNQFNTLLGLTGVLAERNKGKDVENEQLTRHVFSAAQLLYQMMNNLLTWSTSKERLNPRMQHVTLANCVKNCVSSIQLLAKDKDVSIDVKDVPDDTIVVVDPSHLEIILRNIISNAIKYTPSGGHIVIHASVYAKHAAVSIDDDGCGMTQDDVSRFNREQDIAPLAGTNNEMGNGIGLAICRDLARNNGGSIVIEPGRTSGTSVTVLLNTV